MPLERPQAVTSRSGGRLRLIARSAPLPTAVWRDLAGRLRPAGPDHPWHGRRFSQAGAHAASCGTTPCPPDLVAEFLADTAVDDGVYCHPVRSLRLRDYLATADLSTST